MNSKITSFCLMLSVFAGCGPITGYFGSPPASVAGTYTYHCTTHGSVSMNGIVVAQ